MGNYTFDLFFYLFPTLAMFSSFLVMFSPNPMYSALFLMSVFLNSSPPLSLLDHEFSASIFVIIYIGAMMVLFLFIMMMLDIKYSVMHLKVYYYYLMSGFLIMLMAFEFLALVGVDLPLNLDDTMTVPYVNWLNVSIEVSSLTSLGSYLYTYFCPSFISAGVILLVAMMGAISLTLSGFEFSDKKQVLFQQVNSSAKYCLFYVS